MIDGKIAFVTPWYGENIPGGAEAELRDLVHHLQTAGMDLEILTTCIESCDSDWNRNYHKPGKYTENGISVRRFLAQRRFPAHLERVQLCVDRGLALCPEEEDIFCREMVNSQDLMDYIRQNGQEYVLFVFIPHMRGTTYFGCQIWPEKSVLIPCIHDEPCFYLNCFRKTFAGIRGMIFHSHPEMELAQRIYGVSGELFVTLGEAVNTSWEGDSARFCEKYQINSPFILYAGRKAEGKKVNLLIDYFKEYKQRHPGDLRLILIGSGNAEDYGSDYITDLGFVSQQDKYDAYSAASIVCNPSIAESFSLVIMESWLAGTPVLVNSSCAVTADFADKSHGGFSFGNYEDFEKHVNLLLSDEGLASELGRSGRQYVLDNFSWPVIEKRYTDYFTAAVRQNS